MSTTGEELNKGATKLLKNTSIYMIGSMLSKVMNLVMLPYISSQLTTAQYGIYDLIQTISSVLLPVFTLQAIEAAFRFVYMAEDKEKSNIISNVWAIILGGSLLFGVILYAANGVLWSLEYANILLVYYVFNVLINMYQRIARCYEQNKTYAISGIIQTFSMLALQFVCLKYLKLKEDGLVYAYAASVIITCIYIEWNVRSYRQISIKALSWATFKKITKFSAPLIPNSISWWAVSSVNRVVIVSYLGYAANGIYSMSNKFASIVTMIASTFQLAWQEFGLTEKQNTNRKKLFSAVFKHFLVVLMCVTAGGILVQQLFFNILIDPEYAESFFYIPLIMVSVALSSINSFYGAGYFIYEKTTAAFRTTIVGSLVNLVLCYLLVRWMGLYGIALAGIAAYLIMWITRAITMRGYFGIELNCKTLLMFVLCICVTIVVYYQNNNLLSLLGIVAICAGFIAKYFKIIQGFLDKNRRRA